MTLDPATAASRSLRQRNTVPRRRHRDQSGACSGRKKECDEAGVSHLVRFIEADLFEADIAEATVVTLFLLSRSTSAFAPASLLLQPGSRIVSHEFGMGPGSREIH
jgi:hypothetical protein